MEHVLAGDFELICEKNESGLLRVIGVESGSGTLDLRFCDDIVEIGNKAFLSCKTLVHVFLSEKIDLIGDWAFARCSALVSLTSDAESLPNIGRGAFEGCASIAEICVGKNMNLGLARLWAASINGLESDFLFRAADVGSVVWYRSWDILLLSALEGSRKNTALRSRVDVSPDNIGTIDGEMPGESEQKLDAAERKMCRLCFERLIYDIYLTADNRRLIEQFLIMRKYGTKKPLAWESIKEFAHSDMRFYDMYLAITCPNKDEIERMILDLDKDVRARAYLIDVSSNREREDVFELYI